MELNKFGFKLKRRQRRNNVKQFLLYLVDSLSRLAGRGMVGPETVLWYKYRTADRDAVNGILYA